MAQQTHIRLNNGIDIPQIGLGVWQVDNRDAPKVVKAAIDAGYRSIDTAAIYGNEEGVGVGIRDAGRAARPALHRHQAVERPPRRRQHLQGVRREPEAPAASRMSTSS